MTTTPLRHKLARKAANAAFWIQYRTNQLRHLSRIPPLSRLGRRILADLDDEGVSVTRLEELRLASNATLLKTVERIQCELDAAEPRTKALEYASGFEHCVPINPSRIAREYPDLFMWGLDGVLLDLVENCIGLPPAYHGVVVRKELVDGKLAGTRLWHTDSEDLNIIRVMIYLSDVLDDDAGPFEYVPRRISPTYRSFRGVCPITDEEMARVVPRSQWKRCYGARGTVIFGAVAKIFHHGKLPLKGRKMASFYYTSRHPKNERLCRQYSFEAGIPSLRVELTPRQRECFWKYQDALPERTRRAHARAVGF